MSKIEKKVVKDCSVSLKMVSKQRDKLKTLAKNRGITFSDLVNQMLELAYKDITKKEL